jgi:hypothetical protein
MPKAGCAQTSLLVCSPRNVVCVCPDSEEFTIFSAQHRSRTLFYRAACLAKRRGLHICNVYLQSGFGTASAAFHWPRRERGHSASSGLVRAEFVKSWESFLIEASGRANSGVSYCNSSTTSMEFDKVNRSIHFPAFVFLLLLALLFLLSEQFSRFSAPRSTLESGKTTDRVATEIAPSIKPQALTKRDLQSDLAPVLAEFRRRWSFLGIFPHPVEINVSANEERVVSFVDAALNKITRKLRGVQIHLKNHIHSSFNPKVVSRYRPAVNLVARIRSHPAAFYQLGLAHKNGASVPYRLSIGGTGRFGHKKAFANRTDGRSRKKNRSDSRRLERQLAHFFRSTWRRGGYALRP